MISIIKYLSEDESIASDLIKRTVKASPDYIPNGATGTIKSAFAPETFKSAGVAAKRLAGKFGSALSKPGETAYDLSHDKETGASLTGKMLRTKKATGLEGVENRFELAKGVSAATNPEIKEQWGKFLKKR